MTFTFAFRTGCGLCTRRAEGDVHRKWVAATETLMKAFKKFCMMEAKRGLKFKGTGSVTDAGDGSYSLPTDSSPGSYALT